jgi:hypothetical protein
VPRTDLLRGTLDLQISDRKVQTGLFTTFAGLALFMAALGVYGLLFVHRDLAHA